MEMTREKLRSTTLGRRFFLVFLSLSPSLLTAFFFPSWVLWQCSRQKTRNEKKRGAAREREELLLLLPHMSQDAKPLGECLCGCVRLERVDLSSRDGFITRLWGPHVHSFVHVTTWYWDHAMNDVSAIALADGRAAMVEVLECFLILLYCVFCREHYNAYVAQDSPRQVASGQVHMWTWRLHNAINTRQHKLTFPLQLYKTVYIDTCEADAWASAHVSPRWLYWFWTILYLTGLNHPPHLQRFEPRHLQIQAATHRLLHAMTRVIPRAAVSFRQAFEHALSTTSHRWSLYFAWLRCELGPKLAVSLPEPMCTSFHTRERAFHFIYELELATIRAYSTSPAVSVFGDTCFDVVTYFENTYRVKPP
jgi:hypothetical protein